MTVRLSPPTGLHAKLIQAYREHYRRAGLKDTDIEAELVDISFNHSNAGSNILGYQSFIRRASKGGRKIETAIWKMRRVRQNGRDFIVYSGQDRGQDSLGNPLSQSFSNRGFYELPIFRREYRLDKDGDRSEVELDAISGKKQVFELSWPSSLAKLKPLYDPEETIAFSVWDDAHNQWLSCTQEDFENLEHGELIEKLNAWRGDKEAMSKVRISHGVRS